MLPRDEVLKRLKLVRHSSYADRINGKSITMSEIARQTGIARGYLHEIASEKTPIGPTVRAKLSEFFDCQENGCGRTDVRSAPQSAFSTGSGSVFTVKWPDFGPKRRF
jgi:hypothetical protein